MKERLCYISDTAGWVDGNPDGILKKKLTQMRLLAEHFDTVMFGFDQAHKRIGVRREDKFILIKDVPDNIAGKALKRALFYRMAGAYCRKYEIRKLYIRYALTDLSFLGFLGTLPADATVVVEIPTFPYDKERADSFRGKILTLQDHILLPLLKKHVNYIATFSKDSTIASIPCINMQNGVETDNIKMREFRADPDAISLIAVASMNFWHGYDRVIAGMGEYKRKGGTRRIVLHIVGDGPEIPKFREMAENLGITDDVIIHGFKSGAPLDEIAFVSDIAVCSLGLHRLGLTDVSPIKVREYMAQGFPMISVEAVDISDLLADHELLVPMDDSPVSMEDVISFYDKKDLGNPASARKEAETLRRMAYDHCDMKSVFAPAVEAFLSE